VVRTTTGLVLPFNPAASLRGPKHVVKKGKTPVLIASEARQLLCAIDYSTIIGLRDRAVIEVLIYSFSRVSASIDTNIADYYPQGRCMWFRLREKDGNHHEVPANHKADLHRTPSKLPPSTCRSSALSREGVRRELDLHFAKWKTLPMESQQDCGWHARGSLGCEQL